MNNDIYETIKNEVELLGNQEISDGNTEIFKNGILDSLNILHIITFIEQEYSLEINPFDLTLDTLGTLNKITAFILEKQQS